MKKSKLFIACAAAALTLNVSAAFAQDKVYVVTGMNYFSGPFVPSEDDVTLTLNSETGFYENPEASIMMGKNAPGITQRYPNAFKFYTRDDDGEITYIGANIAMSIDLFTGNPNERDFEIGDTAWRISKFADGTSNEGEVTMAVCLDGANSKLIVTQINIEEEMPEALYLWGSTDGGATELQNMTSLVPSEENPMVYTVEFDVPNCPGPFVYDDPEFKPTEEDAPTSGFMFFLTPEKDNIRQSTIVRYMGAINARTIDMTEVETSAEIQLYKNNGGNVIDMTPGKSLLSFNLETLVLTVERVEEDSSAVISIEAAGETTPVYFDLQGRKVNNPEKGVYVKVTGKNSEKITVK